MKTYIYIGLWRFDKHSPQEITNWYERRLERITTSNSNLRVNRSLKVYIDIMSETRTKREIEKAEAR